MVDSKNKKVDMQDGEQGIPIAPVRKKFHGFSMGFLLILLALVVGLYVVCTILAV